MKCHDQSLSQRSVFSDIWFKHYHEGTTHCSHYNSDELQHILDAMMGPRGVTPIGGSTRMLGRRGYHIGQF